MKFCCSTLKVKNLEESIRFYRDIVGLKVKRRFLANPYTEIAFLGDGETSIELIQDSKNREIEIGDDISWGFCVDSLKETLDLVRENGIPVQSGPFQPNPEIKFFYVLDPNGMKIQFIEHT